ncbi:MAG: NAD(P)-dependent oxidoreductase, partial [Pseudomonadota bacterium]
TSRFFPEVDDNAAMRAAFADVNAKANEFLFRRVDLDDAVSAHLCALAAAATPGFRRYVVSATTPFARADLTALRRDPSQVVAARFPLFESVYAKAGFRMFDDVGRVYVNARARDELGWRPVHDFGTVLGQLERGEPIGGPLSRTVGSKGYHAECFDEGPYPVE